MSEQIIQQFLSSIDHLFEQNNNASKRPDMTRKPQKLNKTLSEDNCEQGLPTLRFTFDVETNALKVIF